MKIYYVWRMNLYTQTISHADKMGSLPIKQFCDKSNFQVCKSCLFVLVSVCVCVCNVIVHSEYNMRATQQQRTSVGILSCPGNVIFWYLTSSNHQCWGIRHEYNIEDFNKTERERKDSECGDFICFQQGPFAWEALSLYEQLNFKCQRSM